MSKRATEEASKRRHQTCGVSVVVATNAPKAARSARVLLEPVEHMKMRKLKNEGDMQGRTWEFCEEHDALRLAALVDFGKHRGSAGRIAANNGAACQASRMKVAVRAGRESTLKRKAGAKKGR